MNSMYVGRTIALAAACLLLCAVAALTAADPGKEVIGVMDLKAEGDLKSAAGILSDRLRAELFKTGRFAVMERGEMDAILKEQGFQQSGVCDDKACMVEIGQLLGVTKMVAGSIGMLGTVYLINLRIIEVSSGRLVDTYSGECRCRIEDLGGAMKTAAERLAGGSAAGTAPQATVPAAPETVAQPVQEPAAEPVQAKPALTKGRWTLGLFSTANSADPDVNNVIATYEDPPMNYFYRFVQQSGEIALTGFKGGGLYVSRDLTQRISLRVCGWSATTSGEGTYRIEPAPHNMHPFSGKSEVRIETDIQNNAFAVGGRFSWHFNRLHPYAGVDLIMLASSYSFAAKGDFDGYDTLGIPHQGPIDANVDLDYSGPGFAINAGAVWQFSRRFGLELEVAFSRLELSGYEGSGNLAKLDNVLLGEVAPDEDAEYVLSMGRNAMGGEVYFFERTSEAMESQPIANNVDSKESSTVDFSGPSGRLCLNIFF